MPIGNRTHDILQLMAVDAVNLVRCLAVKTLIGVIGGQYLAWRGQLLQTPYHIYAVAKYVLGFEHHFTGMNANA